jgi:hypothetical protein
LHEAGGSKDCEASSQGICQELCDNVRFNGSIFFGEASLGRKSHHFE